MLRLVQLAFISFRVPSGIVSEVTATLMGFLLVAFWELHDRGQYFFVVSRVSTHCNSILSADVEIRSSALRLC